jgi:hypothetical protein
MLPLFITQLLGQGLGLVANAALAKGKEYIQEKTGIDVTAASMSPEDIKALRQFEMTHEEELLKIKQEDDRISADLEKAYLGDVDSARKMQIAALQQEDVWSKRFLYIFSTVWSLFAFGYIYMITFTVIPQQNVRFADTILGFLLGTIIATMFGFFYGSSITSRNSHESANRIAENITAKVGK